MCLGAFSCLYRLVGWQEIGREMGSEMQHWTWIRDTLPLSDQGAWTVTEFENYMTLEGMKVSSKARPMTYVCTVGTRMHKHNALCCENADSKCSSIIHLSSWLCMLLPLSHPSLPLWRGAIMIGRLISLTPFVLLIWLGWLLWHRVRNVRDHNAENVACRSFFYGNGQVTTNTFSAQPLWASTNFLFHNNIMCCYYSLL